MRIDALGLGKVGLSIAGPSARDVLQKVTRADVSNAAFPFMAIRTMDIGMAPCLVGRVSYTGDLGYEIWMAPEYQRSIYQTLMAAGEEFGIGLFGSRALNALRLEKNYGSWAREYRPIYGPLEAGLDRFVAYGKDADFIGKAGALAERKEGGKLRLRAFIVDADRRRHDRRRADLVRRAVRGWVTSGGYAHGFAAVGRDGLCAEGDRRRGRWLRDRAAWQALSRAHPTRAAVRCQSRADARVRT